MRPLTLKCVEYCYYQVGQKINYNQNMCLLCYARGTYSNAEKSASVRTSLHIWCCKQVKYQGPFLYQSNRTPSEFQQQKANQSACYPPTFCRGTQVLINHFMLVQCIMKRLQISFPFISKGTFFLLCRTMKLFKVKHTMSSDDKLTN